MSITDDTPLFSGLWVDEEERIIPSFTLLKILGMQTIDENNTPEILKGWEDIPTLDFFNQPDQELFPDTEEPVAYYKATGLDELINPNNMYDAFTKSNQEVAWKEANQRYSFRAVFLL